MLSPVRPINHLCMRYPTKSNLSTFSLDFAGLLSWPQFFQLFKVAVMCSGMQISINYHCNPFLLWSSLMHPAKSLQNSSIRMAFFIDWKLGSIRSPYVTFSSRCKYGSTHHSSSRSPRLMYMAKDATRTLYFIHFLLQYFPNCTWNCIWFVIWWHTVAKMDVVLIHISLFWNVCEHVTTTWNVV